jgi:hypothetical protein
MLRRKYVGQSLYAKIIEELIIYIALVISYVF